MPAEGYSIHLSLWGYLLEPFRGISLYFSLFSDIKFQLISWLFWLIFLYVVIRIVKFKQAGEKKLYAVKSLLGIFKVILSFLLLIASVLFVPLSPNRLDVEDADKILIDVHSHTVYSHDGLVTPGENIGYHWKHGFKAWFITDHDEMEGAIKTKVLAEKECPEAVVLKGMEISGKGGQNLLLLGIERDLTSHDLAKEGPEFIKMVHEEYAGVVIVPHWWEEKAVSLQTLVDWGVDGFEVFGHVRFPLENSEQKALIEICEKNGLLALGGTNYHGWGSACDVWTSLRIKGWAGLRNNMDKKKAILTAFREKKLDSFKVITYSRKEPVSRVRYIFEPFVGLFYYFSSLDGYQLLSWLLWSVLIYFLFQKNPYLVKNLGFLIMGIFLLGKGIFFRLRWEEVSSYNNILSDVIKAVLVISILSLLTGIFGFVYGKPRKP